MNKGTRFVSLCLTGTLLAGSLLSAAAAAPAFSDADQITHAQAVETMVELGVIKGKEGGAFDPQGTITRAEMATILCAMHTGGEMSQLVGVTPSFSDIRDHWAEAYVEYCNTMGMMEGRADGSFDLEGTVTASECAKMLLLMLGYDPEVYGLTGDDWEINTNAISYQQGEKGLYDGLGAPEDLDVSLPLTRERAAQMAYNALSAQYMIKSSDGFLSTGEIVYKYTPSEDTFREHYFPTQG